MLSRLSTPLRALVVCLVALAAVPALAAANATDDRIIRDCELSPTGELTGTYTKAELRHAKNNMQSHSSEYSGCYDVIRQALLSAGGGSGGGGGGGGGSEPSGGGAGGIGGTTGGGDVTSAGPTGDGTPVAQVDPLANPHRGTEAPIAIAGTPVQPGDLPSIGKDPNELPAAVVVLLVLLGLAATAAGALTIGRRVIARRRA